MKSDAITKEGFLKVFSEACTASSVVTGFLSEQDRYILTLLALCSDEAGEVLEIGSYRGLSTVLLAKTLGTTDHPRLHACDPWTAPGVPGQDLKTDDETFRQFNEALTTTGVRDQVVVHRAFSSALSKEWNEPLRFLWIDGDHSLSGTQFDFDHFSPHVVSGGFVAFHDVLHPHPGPAQVFSTRVLLSEEWGACGFCGSIGWAQKVRDRSDVARFRRLKLRLLRKLMPLAECVALNSPVNGLNKWKYKLRRARVPHKAPNISNFCSLVGLRAA